MEASFPSNFEKPLPTKLYGVIRFALLPMAFYLISFILLTYPLIWSFSTHFFTDTGDGLQNVWNIWWINKSITELHQLPWYTNYLHYPYGTSLLGQTLNPFNGFLGILLLKFLSLTETHNLIVLFSFVVGGFTAFHLCHYVTKSYWCSMIGGFIFTFSNYHFAHAEGHLQLVSLEWIPLFLLLWHKFVQRPKPLLGGLAAAVLFLVLLCDHYYFLYCVLSGTIILAWNTFRKKKFSFMRDKESLISLGVFVFAVVVTAGPLVFSLLLLNSRDPLLGFHPPAQNSSDLLAFLIPGGHWRFASLTEAYWSQVLPNIHESSVHIGVSVLAVITYVWMRRSILQNIEYGLWYLIIIIFFLLSLGPVLHIWGAEVPFLPLPYAWLEWILPFLSLSGCPVRMMVMVTLAASVLCAIGFKILFSREKKATVLAGFLLIILLIEYLPKPIPRTRLPIPDYIRRLKNISGHDAAADFVSSPGISLYYQTVHEKPLAFGYISRTPTSVWEKDQRLMQEISSRKFKTVYKTYKIRYLITKQNDGVAFYDLKSE